LGTAGGFWFWRAADRSVWDLKSGVAEVTAALDEAEAALSRLLHDRLKGTAIISIGHRSTLNVFHRRRIEVVPDDGFSHLREVPLVSAAE
jgi:vitamin B12/bleomycin/antimicrobial peptide transport system ATP-binding/permease protein